jgi:DNA-binding MarR family transcriptional regulator
MSLPHPVHARALGFLAGYLDALGDEFNQGVKEGRAFAHSLKPAEEAGSPPSASPPAPTLKPAGVASPPAQPLHPDLLTCPKCGKACAGKAGLSRHDWWAHRRNGASLETPEPPMEPLDSHREQHDQACPECPFTASTSAALSWHKRKVHAPSPRSPEESRLMEESTVHLAESEVKVLLALRDGDAGTEALLSRSGLAGRTMRFALHHLREKGLVRSVPDLKHDARREIYMLTSAGNVLLRDAGLERVRA